ncbi:MAG: hypothetical protein GMKNLPBB_03319 [Myxococcota bacterium]|nr:hypothetical protein [Myxococcota bacterium]
MMNRLLAALMVIILAGQFLGCASGTKYDKAITQLPAMPSNQGRIMFYREGSPMGAAIQPDIRLNGEKVGKSTPGGFFHVDRPIGDYEVSCSTEVDKKLTFTLAAGETRYIRTKITMGLMVGHVHPILEDREKAMQILGKCSYIGAQPLALSE